MTLDNSSDIDSGKLSSSAATNSVGGSAAVVPGIDQVVGEPQQYVVDISPGNTFNSRYCNKEDRQSNFGTNVVFDPHAGEEDGGRSIPQIQLSFLGGNGSSSSSSSVSTPVDDFIGVYAQFCVSGR